MQIMERELTQMGTTRHREMMMIASTGKSWNIAARNTVNISVVRLWGH